ncbi:MAG: STAS-like domain-containing protein, partial [Betaproteobacteria bacterium]|nr:STAS-like domain-containing protein [Betaproteobacteria bacterium]
ARTVKKVFDQFSTGNDYGFNKTVVPVKLAKYGNDQLISRSQAKRLLARVELFKMVLFDFTGIKTIGQAFSDEIFRVFARQHPEIELIPVHANSQVKRMIERAKGSSSSQEPENPTSA